MTLNDWAVQFGNGAIIENRGGYVRVTYAAWHVYHGLWNLADYAVSSAGAGWVHLVAK